jgi:hypothetical protein
MRTAKRTGGQGYCPTCYRSNRHRDVSTWGSREPVATKLGPPTPLVATKLGRPTLRSSRIPAGIGQLSSFPDYSHLIPGSDINTSKSGRFTKTTHLAPQRISPIRSVMVNSLRRTPQRCVIWAARAREVLGRCRPPGSAVLGSAPGLNRRHVLDREVWRDSESPALSSLQNCCGPAYYRVT